MGMDFHRAGLLCAEPGNVNKADLGLAGMRALGYEYFGPQGTDGTKRNDFFPNLWGGTSAEKYLSELRKLGFKVAFWSKLYGGDVESQARAAAEMAHELHPDGWMLNPETEFNTDPPLSERYVTALLNRLDSLGEKHDFVSWAINPLGGPSVPAGQTESPWTYPIHMGPWLTLPGAIVQPEEYWTPVASGGDLGYSPLNSAVQYVERLGVPRSNYAHLFGWWNSDFKTPEEYFANVDKAKVRLPGLAGGFAVYLVDQMSTDIIKRFAKGIPKYCGGGSPPPPPPIPDPGRVNRQISQLAHTWLDPHPGDDSLSRLRSIDRIANSTDPQWAAARTKVIAALDAAGA
jgi:hypothetical protein